LNVYNGLGRKGKVSFNKTATLNVTETVEVTKIVEIGWIEGEKDTAPETPDGYEPAPNFDMDFGVAGYLYAYKKIT